MENSVDISRLYDLRIISSLDYYLAQTVCRLGNDHSPLVSFSCAMASRAAAMGHICLDIDYLEGRPIETEDVDCPGPDLFFPKKKQWIAALEKSSLVSSGAETPLVLDRHGKLYLARYHDFQSRLVSNIKERIKQGTTVPDDRFYDAVNRALPILPTYGDQEIQAIDTQKSAVINAWRYPLSIISGGPGTGKTFIINILVGLFDTLLFPEKERTNILCIAPTGKAAAKLKNGMTIHRALAFQEHTRTFTYHRDHPLPVDAVVIDEASMIDIALMTRLLEAIPLTARIVLIGDHHQLTSVETGAVFEDICRSSSINEMTTVLEYNFRSKGASAINRIAAAIHRGDVRTMLDLLSTADKDQVEFIDIREDRISGTPIPGIAVAGFHPFLHEPDPIKALDLLGRFKVLTPTRHGPMGTVRINDLCKNILRSSLNFDIQDRFFKRAVMITKNDYQHNLFNGDSGVIFNDNGRPTAVFRNAAGTACYFDPDLLPVIDDAFAITVHKSQGSEYDHVLLILPSGSTPFVTRQLLYTGFTRARKKVTLVGTAAAVTQAGRRSLKRFSNITGLLDSDN